MTNLKKLIGNKSINTKQSPAELSPRIILLNLYGKPWVWGEYQPTAKKLSIFATRKILLKKLTFSAIKSVIPSPSNSNFYIIPYTGFICSCSHCCCIIFLTADLMHTYMMLILINQCFLNVAFSMTKALNGQSSPKQHFYYIHLSMIFGKLCIS